MLTGDLDVLLQSKKLFEEEQSKLKEEAVQQVEKLFKLKIRIAEKAEDPSKL